MRGSAADGLKIVDTLKIPETSEYPDGSLVRAQNGHFYSTNSGFKNIYEVGLSTDGKKLEMKKTHKRNETIRFMTGTTVGNVDCLFTSSEDLAVRLLRVDGSALTEIQTFKCADPYRLLWLKERSVLLVSEWNVTLNSHSVRAFKFDVEFKKTVEDATVLNAEEGLNIVSGIEAGANGVTLFDWKKRELVDMKVI